MAWVCNVGGKIKSDYRYSIRLVYNNFPWPTPTKSQKQAIEKAAKVLLDTRKLFPNSSLAKLYDPLIMPEQLIRAHRHLIVQYGSPMEHIGNQKRNVSRI